MLGTSRSLIATDKLGLLCVAEETYRSVGGNRQANTDKHLNLIQTISLCLLQEAPNDRSKRPGGCINGSRGSLPVSLVNSHSARRVLSLPFSVSASQFCCEWPQGNFDLQTRAILPLSSCFTYLATFSLDQCCLSLRICRVQWACVFCRKSSQR